MRVRRLEIPPADLELPLAVAASLSEELALLSDDGRLVLDGAAVADDPFEPNSGWTLGSPARATPPGRKGRYWSSERRPFTSLVDRSCGSCSAIVSESVLGQEWEPCVDASSRFSW
jgi:hypothetical protein